MRARPRLLAPARVVALWLCASAPALGIEQGGAAPAGDGERATTIEIVVVGSPEQLELLESAIGPRSFGDAQARWQRASELMLHELWESRERASGVVVRAFIDLSKRDSADLYFADQLGERFLLRSVGLPDGLTPLAREALGQVLELSVRALIEDRSVGMTRAETEELLGAPPSEPGPPAPSESELAQGPGSSDDASLGAAAFYSARWFASEAPVAHGPGLVLGWVMAGPARRHMPFILVRHELSRRVGGEAVSVRWSTTTLEGGYRFLLATGLLGLFAGGRAAAGVDLTSFDPGAGSTDARVKLTPRRLSTAPVLTLAAIVERPLGERMAITLEGFVDAYPVRVHYDLESPEGVSRVLDPSAVRPGALVSLLLH